VILRIKYIFFILVISFGFYLFNTEFTKIQNINLNYGKDFKFEKKAENYKEVLTNNEIKIENFNDDNNNVKTENILIKKEVLISKGDTFFSILKEFNLTDNKIFEIVNKIENFYSLKSLKVDDKILFYSNNKGELLKIDLSLDFETYLAVDINDQIVINKINLQKETYQISKEYKIDQSLYSDGIKNNIPQDILIKIIKLFSFDLDFQRDIKKNTLVSVSYEFDQVIKNDKIKYKDINYALISINDKKLEYFKFLTDDGYIDYFNREGKNVKKSILKTPLDGARLSSNFGMRKHPISGYNKMHKGVDFAAPLGTPIYAGGNGVVEYVGKNGGYGNYIRIRHNNEYKTAYAHLSSFKKGISKGVRVNQGDVIGFVGSTGNSTGPHLHYEIIFQNKQINPLKLKLPSGKILNGKELKRFIKEYNKIYANHLNLLYE
tara:strand:+ start:833 stop:2134 length:1302 start_codon:yes stop_codon:yes gene_type:complete